MELSEIEAFVTISRSGGFTRAAGILHLSQPAISRRIELLERELGAPLFERVPSGIRLTEAGQAFLPYAQQVWKPFRRDDSKYCQMIVNMVYFGYEVKSVCQTTGN